MQYLGGYALHNFHKKFGRTNLVESQQAMAILKAGKLERITDSNQKLVSALNRGGLWSISQRAQQIFLKAECHFRQLTSKPDFIFPALLKKQPVIVNHLDFLSECIYQ